MKLKAVQFKQAGFAHVILLLFLLVIGLVIAGYFFVFNNSVKAIYITDNNPEGVGVVWQTQVVAQSYLVPDEGWRTQQSVFFNKKLSKISDVMGIGKTHMAKLKNLKPNQTYAFRVVVNWVVKERVVVKTAPALGSVSSPQPLVAEVLDKNGKALANTLVMVQLASKTDQTKYSTLLAARVNGEGKFGIDLSNIRNKDLQTAYRYNKQTDKIKLFSLANAGVAAISLSLEDALTVRKFQFNEDRKLGWSLVGKARADQDCHDVQTTKQVCTPICRSCVEASEDNDIPGCGKDPDHPDVCDGEDCHDEVEIHQECVERPEPVTPPQEETPAQESTTFSAPVPENADGGGQENGENFDPPASETSSEPNELAPGSVETTPPFGQPPQGSSGIEDATTPANPVPTPQAIPAPTSQPTPVSLPQPSLTIPSSTTTQFTGIVLGADPNGNNNFTFTGTPRGIIPENKNISWTIDFGDGQNGDSETNGNNAFRLSHQYTQPGTFTITAVARMGNTTFQSRVAVAAEAKSVNSRQTAVPTPTGLQLPRSNPLNDVPIPPSASPKSQESNLSLDLNKQTITLKEDFGQAVLDPAKVQEFASRGIFRSALTSEGLKIGISQGNGITTILTIKDGKFIKSENVDSSGRKVSLAKWLLASNSHTNVLGVSTEANSKLDVIKSTDGKVFIPALGDVEIFLDNNGQRISLGKANLKAGNIYQFEPNLEGKEGEIKLIAGKVSLESGWNLIALNVLPIQHFSAEDLLKEVNSQGGEAVAINRWINNSWQTHEVGNFGTNFKIEVGHGYFVFAKKSSNWLVPAQNDVIKPDVLVDPGWNLLATTNLSITKASELLNHINSNSQPAVGADTVTQYVNNLWQSIKLKEGTVFGKDFDVTNRRSYFIKAQNQGIWKSR